MKKNTDTPLTDRPLQENDNILVLPDKKDKKIKRKEKIRQLKQDLLALKTSNEKIIAKYNNEKILKPFQAELIKMRFLMNV